MTYDARENAETMARHFEHEAKQQPCDVPVAEEWR